MAENNLEGLRMPLIESLMVEYCKLLKCVNNINLYINFEINESWVRTESVLSHYHTRPNQYLVSIPNQYLDSILLQKTVNYKTDYSKGQMIRLVKKNT